MNILFLMSWLLFIGYVLIGFLICRCDLRKGIIPKKYTLPFIYVSTIMWFSVYRFSYFFYLYFVILILIYLFFDLVQHLTIKTFAKGVFSTGDVYFYLMSFSLFPFYITNGFGLFIYPIIAIISLSLVFMLGMVLIKLFFIQLGSKLPPIFNSYNTTVITTTIRFAPLIYFSTITLFLLHII